MARHSAPRNTSPWSTGIRRTAWASSTGLLAATVLGGGAALSSGHLPDSTVDVNRAALALPPQADPRIPASVPPSVVPVPGEPESFDAAALVKAVSLVERRQADQRRMEQEAQRKRAGTSCAAGDSGFETVKGYVSAAGVELRCRFGVDTVYGVAGRASASDHPSGRALDLMVGRDPGEDLAAYAVANMDRLGISYVIYRQRINFGSGWEAMEDRGGVTANHMDHVHVSFDSR